MLLAAPAAAIAQDQLDANISSSCTATIQDHTSVDVICNVGYSMTLDDTGPTLAEPLYVTSADVVRAPLDGKPVAILAPKARDLDEIPESYVLTYIQPAASSDRVLLFSLTQIPN